MKKKEFNEFLLTLKEDSDVEKVKSSLHFLTKDFDNYFYFNTYSTAWKMSSKKEQATLNFDFNFFIPKINSQEMIEIVCENSIYGEQHYGKNRFLNFSVKPLSIKTIKLGVFNAGAMMYEINPEYEEIYDTLNTDIIYLGLRQKEVKSYTKNENFTEYIDKIKNEYILPYLFSKMENDKVGVLVGDNMIEIHIKKADRLNFIKTVSDSISQLIYDIEKGSFKTITQALDEHHNKNYSKTLDSLLPLKSNIKKIKI